MALPIRPVPTLYGEDAKRFIEAADAAERNPHTIKPKMSREEAERIWANVLNG